MTDNNHPITPPPELVQQWRTAPEYTTGAEKLTMVTMTDRRLQEIASQAACWGADQELEACCHLLRQQGFDVVEDLCAARRPPPQAAEFEGAGQVCSRSAALTR